MKIARRLALTLVIAAIVSAAVYGAGWSFRSDSPSDGPGADSSQAGSQVLDPDPETAEPTEETPDPTPTVEPTPTETPDPTPTDEPDPSTVPGETLLGPGDEGDRVRRVQARLRQIDWFEGDVTGVYGDKTAAAVRGFQDKREIPATGEADQRTLDLLHDMTTEPTEAELNNRCRRRTATCPDRSTRSARPAGCSASTRAAAPCAGWSTARCG